MGGDSMESYTVMPDKANRTIMFLSWLIISVIVIVPLALLIIFVPDPDGKIVLSVVAAIFVLVMFFVALWIPAFQRSLAYVIDDEGVHMRMGVFWKRRATVPYRKITNVDITEGPLQRRYGIASVNVQTAGAGGAQGGHAEARLVGVAGAEKIRERILARMRDRAPLEPETTAGGLTDQTALLAAILRELKAIREKTG